MDERRTKVLVEITSASFAFFRRTVIISAVLNPDFYLGTPMIRKPAVFFGISLLLPPIAGAVEPAIITQKVTDQPSRMWADDSGYHRVQARLVGFGPTHVRLFKQNGYHSTLPLLRLSRFDQRYVAGVRKTLVESAASSERPGADGDQSLQAVIYLSASLDLLRELSPPIRERVPITVCILGIPVQGLAYTNADVGVELIPDSQRGVLEMPIYGTVQSQTTSYPSVLRVNTSGWTDFRKRFRLVLDEAGARVEPFAAWSTSNYVTTGISTAARSFRRLILRVGSRRVAGQKAASDAEAARRQRARIDSAFNTIAQDLAVRLDRALARAKEEFGGTEMFRGVQLGFRTNPKHLEATVRLPRSEAIDQPPPIAGNDAPLIIRVHVSALQSSMTEDAQQELQAIVGRLADLAPNAEDSLRQVLEDSDIHVSESDDGTWLTLSLHAKDGQPAAAPVASVAAGRSLSPK